MKNRIKTLRLGALDYKILYYDFTTETIQSLGDMADGYYNFDKQEIHVNTSDTTVQCQINTLLHEILHVIYREYNIKDKAEEEEIVHAMANGLMAIFKNKPLLLKTIKENM